jgi:hypothetical protein
VAKIVREDGPHLHVFANQAAEHFFEILHQRIEVEDLWLENLAAAEGKKLAGECSGAIGGVINAGETAAEFMAGGTIQQELAVTANYGEEIIEVVRDTAGETPDGFHFLRLSKLVARFFQFRRTLGDLFFKMFLVLAELLLDALAVQDFGLQIQLDTVLPLLGDHEAQAGAEKRNRDDYESEESALLSDIQGKHKHKKAKENREQAISNEFIEEGADICIFNFLRIPSSDDDNWNNVQDGPNHLVPRTGLQSAAQVVVVEVAETGKDEKDAESAEESADNPGISESGSQQKNGRHGAVVHQGANPRGVNPSALEGRTGRFVARHVEEKEVDDDPEKDDLDEIENVNRIEAANFEVGFEKERQADRAEPEDRNNVGNIGDGLQRLNQLHIDVAEHSEAEK